MAGTIALGLWARVFLTASAFISDLRLTEYLRDEALRQLKALAHPSDYSLLEWQRTLFYLTGKSYPVENYHELEETLDRL